MVFIEILRNIYETFFTEHLLGTVSAERQTTPRSENVRCESHSRCKNINRGSILRIVNKRNSVVIRNKERKTD